jgi:hypothetical protein
MTIRPTPLLHAEVTDTPLDLVSERFFFLIPLRKETIEWLNTVIYKNEHFWINYWSLTHTFIGILWGLAMKLYPNVFTVWRYIIAHTLFEIWEAWAGGYLTGQRQLVYQEVIDALMDTIFGLLGILFVHMLL